MVVGGCWLSVGRREGGGEERQLRLQFFAIISQVSDLVIPCAFLGHSPLPFRLRAAVPEVSFPTQSVLALSDIP